MNILNKHCATFRRIFGTHRPYFFYGLSKIFYLKDKLNDK
nr:MAG TPA: hypothetical protein [Caudoviricetes sp.]